MSRIADMFTPDSRAGLIARDIWMLIITGIVLLAIWEAHVAVQRVQDSRLAACYDQNARNVATIRALKAIVAVLPPAQRAQAQAGEKSSIEIITALAPVRDCRNTIG